jgi:hypothetical protein
MRQFKSDRLDADAVISDTILQIHGALQDTLHSNSRAEDIFSDADLYSREDYRTVSSMLLNSNAGCRRILLACYRMEMLKSLSTDEYPFQRFDLTETLRDLLYNVRLRLPGLRIALQARLPDYPLAVEANEFLLQRVLYELLRHAAGALLRRSDQTVLHIELLDKGKNCSLSVSDPCGGLPSAGQPDALSETPEQVRRYLRKVMRFFGGSLTEGKNSCGERAWELQLPLANGRPVSRPLRLEDDLYSYEKLNLSLPLVYLEDFVEN